MKKRELIGTVRKRRDPRPPAAPPLPISSAAGRACPHTGIPAHGAPPRATPPPPPAPPVGDGSRCSWCRLCDCAGRGVGDVLLPWRSGRASVSRWRVARTRIRRIRSSPSGGSHTPPAGGGGPPGGLARARPRGRQQASAGGRWTRVGGRYRCPARRRQREYVSARCRPPPPLPRPRLGRGGRRAAAVLGARIQRALTRKKKTKIGG